MSESYVYVACTCFRDGLTTEPPVPRSKIVFDKYGNVMQRRSETPEDDSRKLWKWRRKHACAHRYMRIVEEIWSAPHWREGGEAGALIASGRFPHLALVLDRSEVCSRATILAYPELAALALSELDELHRISPQGTTRIVLDEDGNTVIRPVDYAHLPSPGFSSLNDVYENREPDIRWDSSEEKLNQLIEVGFDGTEFIIRNHPGHEEILRSSALRQQADLSDLIRWSIWEYARVTFEDTNSGMRVTGYTQGIRRGGYNVTIGQMERQAFPGRVTATEVPRVWTDDIWALSGIRSFLAASILTGNPLVGYHSNSSLGFEQ